MKLIISENQYRRLLERKNLNLLNEYQNVNFNGGIKKISPEISTILGYLSTLSDSGTDVKIINDNEIDVITDKEGIKGSLKDFLSSNQEEYKIEDETGKLNIKYEKKKIDKIEDFFIDDEESDYESGEGIVYDETDFDTIRKDVNKDVFNTKVKSLTQEVKNIIKNKYPKIYKKIEEKNNSDKIYRYCFYHYHKGIDIGGELNSKLYFKKPFTVEYIGNECFVLKSDDGYYHRFCHCIDKKLKKGKSYKSGNFASVGNMGSSTSPHVHYEIGIGLGKGGQLTEHFNPEYYWSTYFKGDDLKNPSYNYGRRKPINSLCKKYYK